MSGSAPNPYQGLDLLPQHAKLLADSAISPEVARARGYRSVRTKADLQSLGFARSQCRVPALLIPICNVHGEFASYQARPDDPRVGESGKPVKYETASGTRMVLDVPRSVRPLLGDPKVPLVITEGARKADAAASIGIACAALLGVWGFRGTNDHGGLAALPDWESVAFKASDGTPREIFLAFDSDVTTKSSVHSALVRLKAYLESRGARVRVIYLPPLPDGGKVGLDDYLAAGHAAQDLFALSGELRAPPERPDESVSAQAGDYRERPEGIYLVQYGRGGEAQEARLTNFRARIVSDIVRDDGQETQAAVEIEARLGGRVERFVVEAARFASMNWPIDRLGSGAIVSPGFGNKDHARAGIQTLSGDVPRRRIYTHTGLRKIGDQWVYLHGGGAIGPIGPIPGIEVELPGQLARWVLPPPPEEGELQRCIRASLSLLDLAPDRVIVPVLCSAYRAPLGPTDQSMHLTGPTGAGKSEVAALAAQHFGPGLDRQHLPSWSSTGNSLEGQAFYLKDALFVVDDFAPGGTANDVARLHREADRFLRAQGNRSGRARLGPDGSLRAVRAPRGSTLSTGEDIPRGQSVRARTLTVEVGPGDVRFGRIETHQKHGADGILAGAMAGYVRHIIAKHDVVVRRVTELAKRLRSRAHRSERHRRTATMVGELAAGFGEFLRFAVAAGAITAAERRQLRNRGWKALGEAAARHTGHVVVADPVNRFMDLFKSAIASGEAHVADPKGGPPENPAACGWRLRTFGAGDNAEQRWVEQGRRIGWIAGAHLYLDADAALKAAQVAAGPSGDGVPIGSKTLGKRLRERGLLLSFEAGGNTARRMLEDKRQDVLHLPSTVLVSPPESGQSGHGPKKPDGKRGEPGSAGGPISEAPPESGHGSGHPGAASAAGPEGNGPIGPIPGGDRAPRGGRAQGPPPATGPGLHDMEPEEYKRKGAPPPTPLFDRTEDDDQTRGSL